MASLITIKQGDDTAAMQRGIYVQLPEGDYEGLTIRFEVCGRAFEAESPSGGFDINFTSAETALMPLGRHLGRVTVRNAQGQVYTLQDAVPVLVTDDAGIAYGSEAGTITIAVTRETLPDLSDVNANPRTPSELNEAFKLLLAHFRGVAGAALLLALPAMGELAVHTAPSGSLPFDAPVVTNVSGSAGVGAARPLPKYLHALDFDDTYPEDAAWYYAQPQDYGGCSAVRDGGTLSRNYDWLLDDAAEFVVRVTAGGGRHASVGVANVGTNLTEAFVASGSWSRYYKCLPGRTVDGINDNGVVCEVNVVDGDPGTSGWHTSGDLHPLAAVRWVLDNATNAQHAAGYIAANIRFPSGWTQNFHWMVADADKTFVVENGAAHEVAGRAVMTNFRLYPSRDTAGEGQERYDLLADGGNITDAWYTRAYLRTTNPAWDSEFDTPAEKAAAMSAWETHTRDELRGKGLWQTVHTSVYDIGAKTLRIAVQETDDWYTFAVPAAGGGGGGAVSSVNGKTGAVVLEAADIESGFGTSVMEELSVIAGIADGAAARAVDAEAMAGDALTGVEILTVIKAERPSPSTDGNLASLTEDGDLEDSGIAKASVIHANSYGKVGLIDVESLFLSSLNNVGVRDTGLSLRAELDPLAPRAWVVETIGGTNTWLAVDGDNLSLNTSTNAFTTNTLWQSSAGTAAIVSNLQATVALLTARIAALEARPDLTSWGRYAPDGTENPDPDYMLYLNSPATVFGSGFSWEQSGAYFCLVQSGAVAFAASPGQGEVRFGIDSTNYFGIVQGGSATVGARVNSFDVADGVATLTVDYAGGDFPVCWFTGSLLTDFAEVTGVWADNGDGSATGSFAASGEAGFYKLTTTVQMGARMHSNMPIKAAGGVIGSDVLPPVKYDSVITIQSGGHTYRLPAEEAD